MIIINVVVEEDEEEEAGKMVKNDDDYCFAFCTFSFLLNEILLCENYWRDSLSCKTTRTANNKNGLWKKPMCKNETATTTTTRYKDERRNGII